MTTIKFGKVLKGAWLEDFYDLDTLQLVSKSTTKVVYKDSDGDQIVLTGKGFAFSGNFATKGTVTGADFTTGPGGKYLTFTKGDFKASTIFSDIKDKDFFGLLTRLTADDDIIIGSSNEDDIIIGDNAGNDRINGGNGDDFIKGTAGNDVMDGGKGFDTLTYEETFWDKDSAKKGIFLDAMKGTVKDSWGGTDKFRNFEEYRGSHLSDKFIGSAKDERFTGFGGKDNIDGGGGWDEVRYHRDQRYEGKKGACRKRFSRVRLRCDSQHFHALLTF